MSEAIYLADPDGNGIEIYADRPSSTWEYVDGKLRMDTLPFDAQGVLAELVVDAAPWQGIDARTKMGHIHLHVGDLNASGAFYTDVLGFEYMAGLHSAAFVSAGGYHHHIGFNTWNGIGAPPPPPDAVGLRYFSVILPNERERTRILERLSAAGIPYEQADGGVMASDPARNRILFCV